ncbi:hypothetical protein AB28_0903 [Raoultella ornithinolytica 2-156-04_S1_C2]|nr:hypothetical protein AB00_0895 [Raoultella ornithinolytica 2-156-04_S1_C1]KDX16151.1 hypothetical protein AB28_0903 [Raoultella ornithinolytica 2-156-04_S1_C2]
MKKTIVLKDEFGAEKRENVKRAAPGDKVNNFCLFFNIRSITQRYAQ